MRELALILNGSESGAVRSISICRKPLIEFDEWGEMTGIAPQPAQHCAPHHRGVHAGGQRSRGRPLGTRVAWDSLYRIHEAPDPHVFWSSRNWPSISATLW